MSGWRPEGWKHFQIKEYPLHCLAPKECTNLAYEIGADAMLKALREKGHPLRDGEGYTIAYRGQDFDIFFGPARLVVIPDDE